MFFILFFALLFLKFLNLKKNYFSFLFLFKKVYKYLDFFYIFRSDKKAVQSLINYFFFSRNYIFFNHPYPFSSDFGFSYLGFRSRSHDLFFNFYSNPIFFFYFFLLFFENRKLINISNKYLFFY